MSVATYATCELTEVRVSVIIYVGLCRCVFIKETGLGQARWTQCSQTWLGSISSQWHWSVGITALPLHLSLEADLLYMNSGVGVLKKPVGF